jgi:hypothetical protein
MSEPTAPTIDQRRIPHELRRALDAAGILVDTLEPGLYVRPEPGHLVVIDAHGNELCNVPTHRLMAADYDRLWILAEKALEDVPPHLADQLLAGVRDNDVKVYDDPGGEWVRVDVSGRKFMIVHRARLVDGWPAEDPDNPDQHPHEGHNDDPHGPDEVDG